MQRAEKARDTLPSEKTLSILMRVSWLTNRFWFNYATRKPLDIYNLFEKCRKRGDAAVELPEEILEGLEPFVHMKMKQVKVLTKSVRNFRRVLIIVNIASRSGQYNVYTVREVSKT